MDASKNLAVVLHAPNDLRVEPKQVEQLKEDEVLIEMKSVGICGSDVHYWTNGRIGPFILEAPMVLGHEASGRIAGLGSRVKCLKVGDRVAIEPGVACCKCKLCLGGRYNLCEAVKFSATPPYDGSLARYYKHSAHFCHKLPDNVSYEEGALLEPLSVAVHASRRAEITGGDRVLVLGAGPIGLLNLLTAKAMGAVQVCVTDIDEKRLEIAKKLGADAVLKIDASDTEELARKIEKLCGGYPNKTIECSGAESSIRLGIKATESGGNLVLVGMGKSEIQVPLMEAGIREVNIIGVFRYANCYPIALSLICSGRIDVKPLITHNFNLKESSDAFKMAKSAKGIKVIIHCDK